MKPFPTKELLYFVGKICSIFTTPSSRDLKLEDTRNYPASLHRYFLGVVEAIDEHGIYLTQVTKGLKVFVMKDHLIAIAEEEVLNPDNPKDAEEISAIRCRTNKAKAPIEKLEKKEVLMNFDRDKSKHSPYIDAEAMKRIADDLNKNFGEQQA